MLTKIDNSLRKSYFRLRAFTFDSALAGASILAEDRPSLVVSIRAGEVVDRVPLLRARHDPVTPGNIFSGSLFYELTYRVYSLEIFSEPIG